MLTIDTFVGILSFGVACFGIGYALGVSLHKKYPPTATDTAIFSLIVYLRSTVYR